MGRVDRSHGAEGEMKVRLDEPAAGLSPAAEVVFETDGEGERFAVESWRRRGNALILKLQGIDSAARAEAFRGRDVLVAEAAFLPPPGCDTYFQFQIVGSQVVTRDGRLVGTVRGVLEAGGHAVLALDAPFGREVLVPFTRSICVEVDPAARRIVIDPPDGLLDLDEI